MSSKYMMRSYFLFLFFIVGFFTQSSFAEYKACGVNEPCRDGYYCMGAVGQSSSGVCTANGLNITLCSFVKFVQNDIFTYIALFASVFIGIFLFIGRASTTVVAQVVIGIGILFGSQQLLLSISGENQEVCSASEAKTCLSDVEDISGASVITNSQDILNLEKMTDFQSNNCNGLKCAIWSCPKWTKTSEKKPIITTGTGTGTVETQETEYEIFYTCAQQKQQQKIIFDQSLNGTIKPEPKDCPNFEVTCFKVKSPVKFNYLSCQNKCTGREYYAKVAASTGITSCKALALRDVKYQ